MLTLSIKYKDTTHQVKIEDSKTVGDLKNVLNTLTKIPAIQQELSVPMGDKKSIFNDDQMPLSVAKINNESKLSVKNLGKQIKWDYVFFVEYGGPLIIFPLLYLLGARQQYTMIQNVALLLAVLHYAKREYETAFVHVFSRYTMPFKRIFINSVHYWVFFALLNGIQIFMFPSTHEYSPMTLGLLVGLWALFEFCNFQCHVVLSSFRKKKTKVDGEYVNASKSRGIPYGWGFNLVSCANYFWEVMGWLIFAIITRAFASWFFLAVSMFQMIDWAIKKHKNYRKEFQNYPKNRKAMIPFII